MNSVLKAGGRLALGTDWPAAGYVSSYRPLEAIQVALTRAILPQYGESSSPRSCRLQTSASRWTRRSRLIRSTRLTCWIWKRQIGSLEVGKLADIVVLEKDLYKIPPTDISTTKVKLTMMNGKIT